MNATDQALRAYAPNSANVIRTGRSSEIQAFSQITARLSDARKQNNFNALVSALHDNRKLWSLLAVDVADAQNGLSAPLRAQIFYLAEFTVLQTGKILRKEADVDALIDINRAVMAGLVGNGGTQ